MNEVVLEILQGYAIGFYRLFRIGSIAGQIGQEVVYHLHESGVHLF